MKREGERKLKQRFESLDILLGRWHDGTFGEIIDDWKWILRYGKSYRRKIFLYVILGILSTTFGVVSSVAGKYLIDSITGYQYESWHLRYVGEELAKKLYNDGNWLTIEEYYGINSNY